MKKLIVFFVSRIIGRINWIGIRYFMTGKEFMLKNQDVKKAADLLLKERLIGVTYNRTHLSSYVIALGHFLLTGRWVFWCHAWINVDDEVSNPYGMQIYESVSEGAIKSPFWRVILVDGLILLKPKYLNEQEWDAIPAVLESQQGTKYDVLCRPKDPKEINCVERVVMAMLAVDPTCLPGLTKMMEKHKNLTPQMLIECGDFEICLEIKR